MSLWRTLRGILCPHASLAEPQEVPRTLYKYLSIRRCQNWLKDKTIGFAALDLLNDPYEGVISSLLYSGAGATHLREDRSMLEYRVGGQLHIGDNPRFDPDARDRRRREEEQLNREIEARRADAVRAISECRILSLTRTPDNMVMWAHYASNSQGLCIGIDWVKANLLNASAFRSRRAMRSVTLSVDYEDHPFQSRFQRPDNPVHYALGRKHTDWAYEREVRVLRHATDFECYSTEHRDKVGLLPLPPEAVTEIVLGSNPDGSVRELLDTELRHFPLARLRRLQIDTEAYRSRLREVDSVEQLRSLFSPNPGPAGFTK